MKNKIEKSQSNPKRSGSKDHPIPFLQINNATAMAVNTGGRGYAVWNARQRTSNYQHPSRSISPSDNIYSKKPMKP